jgi:GT2 family glycosyltransferase
MMLTHNRLPQLTKLIGGLESRIARGDIEFLIFDNGSEIQTVNFVTDLMFTLRGAAKVRVLSNVENIGVAAGRDGLLKQATGEYLIFLDSDVEIIAEDWIERAMEMLEPENVGMVGPAGSFVQWTPDGAAFVPAIPGECDVVAGWCQVFKREVLEAGVRLDLGYGMFYEEDSDFCLQIRAAGWDVFTYNNSGLRHMPGQSGAARVANRSQTLSRMRTKWQGKGLIREEGAY